MLTIEDTHTPTHKQTHTPSCTHRPSTQTPAHPRIAADPRKQCVQDGVVVVAMHQDEAQEGLQQGLLCDAAQEQFKVGCAGDHLIHRRLDPTPGEEERKKKLMKGRDVLE